MECCFDSVQRERAIFGELLDQIVLANDCVAFVGCIKCNQQLFGNRLKETSILMSL